MKKLHAELDIFYPCGDVQQVGMKNRQEVELLRRGIFDPGQSSNNYFG